MSEVRQAGFELDGAAAGLDALAFLVASELTIGEKIARLRQWRYDMLLLEIADTEGFGAGGNGTGMLEHVSKVLLHLERSRPTH
jgi:hypothetical protein